MTPILEVTGISKTYGSANSLVVALDDVSLVLERGEAVALVGPSGCGKSTLLGVIGLMLMPHSGSLRVDGTSAPNSDRERAQMRNHFFGYVHQDYAIVDDESVEKNVSIPLEYASPRVSRSERRERVSAALTAVGIETYARKRASRLSGGERQRVAIARALVNLPSVVLADEPSAALDGATAHEIVSLLLQVRERGASLIIATHDPRVSSRCDRVVGMIDGHIPDSSLVLPAP